MNVYQRLNKARADFHALKLEKTGHNKFAGYRYFELGDFLIPALKVFADNGLCAIVSFDADSASMAVVNIEDPQDSFRFTSPMGSAALKGCHEVQNIGAVETYQRRYLWVAALEIVEHDAVDASEPVKEEPQKSVRLPKLSPSEAAKEHDKWMEVKSLLVDEEGDPDQAAIALHWSRLPSNVRTAIKAHGEAIKLETELDNQSRSHFVDLAEEA